MMNNIRMNLLFKKYYKQMNNFKMKINMMRIIK